MRERCFGLGKEAVDVRECCFMLGKETVDVGNAEAKIKLLDEQLGSVPG